MTGTATSTTTTSPRFRILSQMRLESSASTPSKILPIFCRTRCVVQVKKGIRYGYWMPVFGGWLRNVEDEQMEASWQYTSKLARRSEEIGFDLSLIAALNMNDIKGIDAPSLDAWSTSAALAAVTKTLELMVAVRPTFHLPALFAKQAANIDHISGGRLALNVVSSWWEQEARMYGVDFERHDDRYGRTSEWLDVVNGAWSQKSFDHKGKYYQTHNTVLEPRSEEHTS